MPRTPPRSTDAQQSLSLLAQRPRLRFHGSRDQAVRNSEQHTNRKEPDRDETGHHRSLVVSQRGGEHRNSSRDSAQAGIAQERSLQPPIAPAELPAFEGIQGQG